MEVRKDAFIRIHGEPECMALFHPSFQDGGFESHFVLFRIEVPIV